MQARDRPAIAPKSPKRRSSARTSSVRIRPSANSCALRQRAQKKQPSEQEPRDQIARAREAMKGRAHALFIHFQADQHPRSTPISNNGPVKNRPVPNRASRVAADENADQGRRHDDPAEHADLRQTTSDRRLPFREPSLATFAVQPRAFHQRVRLAGLAHARLPPAGRGRKCCMMRRMALELQPRAFDMLGSLGLDIGAEPAKNFHIQRRVRVRRAPLRGSRWRFRRRRRPSARHDARRSNAAFRPGVATRPPISSDWSRNPRDLAICQNRRSRLPRAALARRLRRRRRKGA